MHRNPSQVSVAQEDVAERRERRTGILPNPIDIGLYALICSTFLGCWVVRSIGEHWGSVPRQRAQEVGIRELS